MSLGRNATISTKIESLKRTSSRLERRAAVTLTDESRIAIQKDREQGMILCNEIMQLLKTAQPNEGLERLQTTFKSELDRFEKVISKIVSQDTNLLNPAFLEEGYGATDDSMNEYHKTHQQRVMEKTKLLSKEEMEHIDIEQMRERQREIQQVERDVAHIHEMFTDLNALVVEQGEQLDSIEANITTANIEVEGGLKELETAEDYQRRARNRKCIIVIFFAIVIAVVVLVMTKYLR